MNDTAELGRIVDEVLAGLEYAWNTADADAFGTHFHADAEFVDVLGRFLRGRAEIADLHRRNWDTIHVGSEVRMARLAVRRLAPELVLAHSSSAIHVPAGPVAGDFRATQTVVLDASGESWRIRAFHNTVVREVPGAPEPSGQGR